MKDSSISKYHLFSGVSVMVIAYLTLKLVDCLEKRLSYRHIRRFAD